MDASHDHRPAPSDRRAPRGRDLARDGERVLERAAEAAREVFGPRLSAAFALGSLAHGGFAPLVSDVDLMLVLDRAGPGIADDVERIRSIVRGEGELGERLSVFWSDWDGVRRGVGPFGRLPEVDRRDLLDSGRLLLGADRRAGAVDPDPQAIVRQAAEFALSRFDTAYRARLRDPAGLVDAGPRAATKAVLFPIRFLYTLHTGRIGQNEAAGEWFVRRSPRGELAGQALHWRLSGITDVAAARRVLGAHLLDTYTEFADAYARHLEATGEPRLAQRLGEWSAQLNSDVSDKSFE